MGVAVRSGYVIHPQWVEHHVPVAAGSLRGLCEIRTEDTQGTYNPVTKKHDVTPGTLLHSGPFRAQKLATGSGVQTIGEQQVTVGDYLIVIGFDANGITPDCLITFIQCDDPDLVGKRMTVTSIGKGENRFERDLIALDNLG